MGMPRKWPRGYYVYTLCLRNGKPFYVGFGKGARAQISRWIHRKIEPDPIITLIETVSRDTARALEEKLIQTYGRTYAKDGILINKVMGMGSKGFIKSLEVRKAIAAGRRGKKLSKATRLLISKSLIGNQRRKNHNAPNQRS